MPLIESRFSIVAFSADTWIEKVLSRTVISSRSAKLSIRPVDERVDVARRTARLRNDRADLGL